MFERIFFRIELFQVWTEREREVKNETRCVGDVSEREFLKF